MKQNLFLAVIAVVLASNVYSQNQVFTGLVGIGMDPTGSHKLEVKGTIRSRKIIVDPTTGADFVFAPGYKLPDLQTVEEHIKEHQHLPEIAPAAEMIENGVDVIDLNIKLLQKVEELTLYIIEQNKRITSLEEQIK